QSTPSPTPYPLSPIPFSPSPDEVLDLMIRLVDRSLVVADVQSGETRYRMLESIGQYALEKLREAGEERVCRALHRDRYLQLADALALDGGHPSVARAKALDRLGSLEEDLGDHEHARKLYEESLALWRALGDRAGTAKTLHNLGIVLQRMGERLEAERLYLES